MRGCESVSRLRGQLHDSRTLNPGVERCRSNDPLRCATTRPDRSLLQSLKSVATTCVRTVCNDRTSGHCKISTYNDQRGVCNLVSNHLSSFMRGASGADLPALPATKTVLRLYSTQYLSQRCYIELRKAIMRSIGRPLQTNVLTSAAAEGWSPPRWSPPRIPDQRQH